MPVRLAEPEIAALTQETKHVPPDWRKRLRLRPKSGHDEGQLDVTGEGGNDFRIIIRQSQSSPIDFSVILCFCPKDTNREFRLRRYNGKSHEHTNPLERQTFYDFHVHQATERYQELGEKEDAYAEPSSLFSDVHSATACLLTECGLVEESEAQMPLFPPGEKP